MPAVTVLGIAGSPRRRGNTETLLDRFLEGAESVRAEVTKLVAAELAVAGCVACDGCRDDGRCVVRDDFDQVYDGMVAADVVALAAPLYFWNLPAQVKAVVDRSQCQWARKCVLRAPPPPTPSGREWRRGVFICVGGDSRRCFDGVVHTVKDFFLVHAIDYWADLLYGDVDARGAIGDHPRALQEAFDLGVRAVEEGVHEQDR